MFSYEFGKISKNMFLYRTPPVTVSVPLHVFFVVRFDETFAY